MELHVLGSAGYHGNGFRETTCLMIPEVGIILDAGTGFRRVRALLKEVPEDKELSILLSHAHIDHSVGLTYGISTLLGTDRMFTIYGDIKHIAGASEKLFGGPLFPLTATEARCQWGMLNFAPDKSTDVNKVPVRVCPLPHPGGSTGYRLKFPHGDLVFITDTCADYVPRSFVRNARTLVHESTFLDTHAAYAEPSGHSHTSQVLRLAKEAGVERLVLIHLNNIPELVRGHQIHNLAGDIPENLPFEVIVAEDEMVIDV